MNKNILCKKNIGRIPLQRSGCKMVDNIKMVIQAMVWKDVDCIYLAHDRIQWHARPVSPRVMAFVTAFTIVKCKKSWKEKFV